MSDDQPELVVWIDVQTGQRDPSMPVFRADGKPHGIWAQMQSTEWWRNIDKEWVAISDIDERYARNILRWLEQRAWQIQLGCVSNLPPGPTGDMASYFWEQEIADEFDQDALPWLRRQPLYQAIAARIPDHERSVNETLLFPDVEPF